MTAAFLKPPMIDVDFGHPWIADLSFRLLLQEIFFMGKKKKRGGVCVCKLIEIKVRQTSSAAQTDLPTVLIL